MSVEIHEPTSYPHDAYSRWPGETVEDSLSLVFRTKTIKENRNGRWQDGEGRMKGDRALVTQHSGSQSAMPSKPFFSHMQTSSEYRWYELKSFIVYI